MKLMKILNERGRMKRRVAGWVAIAMVGAAASITFILLYKRPLAILVILKIFSFDTVKWSGNCLIFFYYLETSREFNWKPLLLDISK